MRERISETYHELINIDDFSLLYSQLRGRKTLSSLLVAIMDSIPLLPLQRGEGGGGWGKQEGGKVMVLKTLASHQYLGKWVLRHSRGGIIGQFSINCRKNSVILSLWYRRLDRYLID